MRNRLLLPALGGLLLVPAGLLAQGSPVSDAIRNELATAKRNMVAAAAEMPADKFAFKPTDAQRSFGQLVLHVAGSNVFMCSSISGKKAPEMQRLAPTAPKGQLMQRLRDSFAFCESALADVTDADLGAQVPYFGRRTVSRATAMIGLAQDWADHYSQQAMYLRLNGHLPPTARRRQGM